MEVGGIRISHMSDITEAKTMALTVTRANKKPFTVKPLAETSLPKAAPPRNSPSPAASSDAGEGAALITADQAIYLSDLLRDKNIDKESFLKKLQLPSLEALAASRYAGAVSYLKEK